MRLDGMQKMEVEYLEEIEQLKEEVDRLRCTLDERKLKHQESFTGVSQDPCRDANQIVHLIDDLQQELEASEKKIAELKSEISRLQERIDILEISKDNATLNTTNDAFTNELISEIENLKAALASEQSGMKKMQILYDEKCEDLNSASQHIKELEIVVKNLREEISELNLDIEGLKAQTGSVDNTRGNSLFSEIEDRRRRAELLVKKQQSRIAELECELANVQSEYQKKLLQHQHVIASGLTKADSEFIVNLYAENDRLSREVSRLESVENMIRDKHLEEVKDNERMSAAFGRDNSSQQGLIKALGERILAYKCSADKAKQESTSLRERLMASARTHYDLTRELTRQRFLVQSLTQELQSLKGKCIFYVYTYLMLLVDLISPINSSENQTEARSTGEDRDSLPPMDMTVSGKATPEQTIEEERVECKQS
ncbi:hypothetical protein Aperf_G00000035311 [Anoplocephala perfoliata]